MGFSEARDILEKWKGDSYTFGVNVLSEIGRIARKYGSKSLIIGSKSEWAKNPLNKIVNSLRDSGVSYYKILGSRPNCPREDMYRITSNILKIKPDSIIALGGGSTIDCVKAANILSTYNSQKIKDILNVEWYESCTIDPFFGTGMVTKIREITKKPLHPLIAVQTASGSAAHLTKYSNITDPTTSQKKLIVDDAIVPDYAIFDYEITRFASRELTIDGGLDGISHIWEVFMGAAGKDYYGKLKKIAIIGIKLIVKNLKRAVEKPDDIESRIALGLGTDLGGYAIMIGGTNGPHLGSFSLVDILSHGRACAILNPYYTIFFSSKIQDQLRSIASILKEEGYIEGSVKKISSREIGIKVAEGMFNFNRSIGFPTTLKETGVTRSHIEKMLRAAKDVQLKMKLLNMPIPLDVDKGDIERYMKGVLEAAYVGDINLIEIVD